MNICILICSNIWKFCHVVALKACENWKNASSPKRSSFLLLKAQKANLDVLHAQAFLITGGSGLVSFQYDLSANIVLRVCFGTLASPSKFQSQQDQELGKSMQRL